MSVNAIPNPGSPEAVDQGCACAVIDNHHGRGITDRYGGTREKPVFWIIRGCPVHDREPEARLRGIPVTVLPAHPGPGDS